MQLSCTFCFVWHAKSTKPFQRFWQPFLECGNNHINAIWGVPRFAEVFGSEKVEQTFPCNSTKCGKENRCGGLLVRLQKTQCIPQLITKLAKSQ